MSERGQEVLTGEALHGMAGIKDALKYSLERVAGHFRTIPRFVSCRSLGLMACKALVMTAAEILGKSSGGV